MAATARHAQFTPDQKDTIDAVIEAPTSLRLSRGSASWQPWGPLAEGLTCCSWPDAHMNNVLMLGRRRRLPPAAMPMRRRTGAVRRSSRPHGGTDRRAVEAQRPTPGDRHPSRSSDRLWRSWGHRGRCAGPQRRRDRGVQQSPGRFVGVWAQHGVGAHVKAASADQHRGPRQSANDESGSATPRASLPSPRLPTAPVPDSSIQRTSESACISYSLGSSVASHGFTNILACRSGLDNAANASRTPCSPTWPVISGATSIIPSAM
jgi:hypothetical protein